MFRQTYITLLLLISLLSQSCKLADLRTSELNPDLPNREKKAIQMLDNPIAKYGLDKLEEAETYTLRAKDNWKGLYALTNPFPRDNEPMEMRFRPNSFDGQFNYLEGGNKTIYGVQSFKHYRIKENA